MRGARAWFLFTAGFSLAIVARALDLHPWVIQTKDPERAAAAPASDPHARRPIVLWVAPELLADTGAGQPAARRDWGLAWSNLLSQELVLPSIEAVPDDPSSARAAVIVLTAGAARAAANPEALEAALESLATAGRTIVIEMPPSGPLASLAGLVVPAEPSGAADTQPLAPGPQAPAWLPAALAKLPAPTLSLAARSAGPSRVLLRRGAYDALTSRPCGQGTVIGVAFDLGRLLTAWQQGPPNDDFRVPSRWSARTGVAAIQSVDLVAASELLEAAFPFADLIERLVADEIRRASGLAGWWPIPEAAPGGFILTHDEEEIGDKAVYQAEYAHQQSTPTTFFVIPGHMTTKGAERLRAAGAEIALHWDRGFPEPRLRKLGLGPFQPLAVRESLAEQLQAIVRLAAPQAVVSQRLHGLLWGDDWAGTFRALESAGIHLDSSLGPTGDIPPGFPFGTALPFHPLDANGRPFALWEVPFTFQDDERMQRGDTARLLAANGVLGHGLVVPIYHSSTMVHAPSVDRMEEWLGAPAAAAAAGHWRGSFADLVSFLAARDAADLQVEGCTAAACLLTVHVSGPGQALHLSAATAAGPLAACALDATPQDLTALPRPDSGRALLPIPPGEHRVELHYGPPR